MKILDLLATKVFAQASDSLVPCTGASDCNFGSLFELFNRVLTWFIWAAVPIATVAIAYAGWLMIWGSASPGKESEGKKILWDTIIGLATVLAAALIIKAVLYFLTSDPQYQNFIQ